MSDLFLSLFLCPNPTLRQSLAFTSLALDHKVIIQESTHDETLSYRAVSLQSDTEMALCVLDCDTIVQL